MQFFNYRPSWPLFKLVAELKKRRTAGALMLYSEWSLPPMCFYTCIWAEIPCSTDSMRNKRRRDLPKCDWWWSDGKRTVCNGPYAPPGVLVCFALLVFLCFAGSGSRRTLVINFMSHTWTQCGFWCKSSPPSHGDHSVFHRYHCGYHHRHVHSSIHAHMTD